jgi:hypothetical protein
MVPFGYAGQAEKPDVAIGMLALAGDQVTTGRCWSTRPSAAGARPRLTVRR